DLGGTSGWVAFEANAGVGLGVNIDRESPHANIGSVTWPNFGWTTSEAYISELAWAQSFLDGTLIVQAGMIDQTLYLDVNSYANNNYGQLMNWAFVNSQVLPLSFGSLGAVVQWQPLDWLYVLYATGANNTPSGRPPWFEVSSDNWSHIGEIGFISEDTFGLGAGTLRVQPFLATVAGQTGGGVALNVEQSLGKDSPFAWYGRFGVGSQETAQLNGAKAQVATGLVISAPSEEHKLKQLFDYVATGFAWTQVATPGSIHSDEYVFEATIFRRITPTLGIQPDVQVIWDPAYGSSNVNVVFQLQLVLTW
ncbi:MAG: hypothetical protein JNK53_08300, partial [Phycisphaerae bacterium]|nr:hypothetical protein [Phycisphaerae bacterium]